MVLHVKFSDVCEDTKIKGDVPVVTEGKMRATLQTQEWTEKSFPGRDSARGAAGLGLVSRVSREDVLAPRPHPRARSEAVAGPRAGFHFRQWG